MAEIDGFTQCVSNAFQKYVETGDFFTLASEWSDCNMNYLKELQQGGVAGPFTDFSALFQLLNAHSLVLFEALQREQKLLKEVEQLKAHKGSRAAKSTTS